MVIRKRLLLYVPSYDFASTVASCRFFGPVIVFHDIIYVDTVSGWSVLGDSVRKVYD